MRLWFSTDGCYLPLKFLYVIFKKLALIRCESSTFMREAK